jgi:hypothetical protein
VKPKIPPPCGIFFVHDLQEVCRLCILPTGLCLKNAEFKWFSVWHAYCKIFGMRMTESIFTYHSLIKREYHMKSIFAALMMALLVVGCDNSNPVDERSDSQAMFGEETMYKTAISTDTELEQMQGNGPGHDSLRHGRMLGHLKMFVGLTDVQFDSVKVYAQTMFVGLNEIRSQVHDSLITREEAKVLVTAVRAQFIASVTAIITADQTAKFEEWVANFWNKPPHRKGPGGRGGHGGPGGGGPGGGPGGRP